MADTAKRAFNVCKKLVKHVVVFGDAGGDGFRFDLRVASVVDLVQFAEERQCAACVRTRRERLGGCGFAEKLDDLPSSHAPSQQQTIQAYERYCLIFASS